jgi:hypothetical protein
MNLVVIESPYAGDIPRNVAYAQRCLRDCIARGELPFASHLLYTQCLNDLEIKDRERGIELNLEMIARCDYVVVYGDLGLSPGMHLAIDHAEELGKPVHFRTLGSIP